MAAIQAYLGGYSFDRFLLELAPINGMERYILKGAWELWTAMNS